MAWCCLATSHYLNQYWPRSMSLYGIIRPQWVKLQILLVGIIYDKQSHLMFHFRVVQHGLFIFQHHLIISGTNYTFLWLHHIILKFFLILLVTFYLLNAGFLRVHQDKWNMKPIISNNIRGEKGARRHKNFIDYKWLISFIVGIHKIHIRSCSMLQHHLLIFHCGEPRFG